MGAPPTNVPRATYRLQFRKEFTFADAMAIVPYLAALGVSHVYASPLLTARPGSPHGYDIVDHNSINPEFGGEAGFDAFVETLRRHDMGLVLDIVPNHMWIGQENPWWMDVLEWGPTSPMAGRFDVDWETPEGRKLLLPVLGDQYGVVLERGELAIGFDEISGAFEIQYFDKRFPLNAASQLDILHAVAQRAPLGALLEEMRERAQGAFSPQRREALRQARCKLAQGAARDAQLRKALDETLSALNGAPGDSASFDRLHAILDRQAYRLAFWRVAAEEINYRRFFDVNELAGLRMEQPELFDVSHAFVARLIREGKVQGLRIDHIDGLRAPREYLFRLQALAQEEGRARFYVVVEKILAAHERLRSDWPIAGDTGYAFMAAVNGVFVDPAGERYLTRFYRQFTGDSQDFETTARAAKRLIMTEVLSSELNVLAEMFHRIARQSRRTRDFTLAGMREALENVVAHFPVYRAYVTPRGADAQDRRDIEWAIGRARKGARTLDVSIYDFIAGILTLDSLVNSPHPDSVTDAALRFQQYTGPVMAKAVEDTAFYRYTRLVSLNEVGSYPGYFGLSPAAFHEINRARQRDFPFAMSSTATHDHKRGEDARARLNVLSEIPREWSQQVRRWSRWNARRKTQVNGRAAPEANAEYLFYQTIVGVWPYAMRPPDYPGLEAFRARIGAYMRKAAREAKSHTSWLAPDEDYEAALDQFVARALGPEVSRPFLDSVFAFVEAIAPAGAANGLAQTLLKLTCPGVPDIYQGAEGWDLSLVDPDNRRPVDYDTLAAGLAGDAQNVARHLPNWRDGRIKQALIRRVLDCARAHEGLFTQGGYRELRSVGASAENVFAFARADRQTVAVVVAPRLMAGELVSAEGPGVAQWGDCRLKLEGEAALLREFTEVLSGRTLAPSADGHLELAVVFGELPVALLIGPLAAAP